ncbi:hypothetical protein B0H11DRAFT_2125139 [Mycena galericulata]|nr:hypothetical protein B0H11DRAFT_2125139 [Mycena galericulata]
MRQPPCDIPYGQPLRRLTHFLILAFVPVLSSSASIILRIAQSSFPSALRILSAVQPLVLPAAALTHSNRSIGVRAYPLRAAAALDLKHAHFAVTALPLARGMLFLRCARHGSMERRAMEMKGSWGEGEDEGSALPSKLAEGDFVRGV